MRCDSDGAVGFLEALASGVEVSAPFADFKESYTCTVFRRFTQVYAQLQSVDLAGRRRCVQFGSYRFVACLPRECDGGICSYRESRGESRTAREDLNDLNLDENCDQVCAKYMSNWRGQDQSQV